MDTNIRIEHKKLTTTSTYMNDEDEDEFTLMFDGFWKVYPQQLRVQGQRGVHRQLRRHGGVPS